MRGKSNSSFSIVKTMKDHKNTEYNQSPVNIKTEVEHLPTKKLKVRRGNKQSPNKGDEYGVD